MLKLLQAGLLSDTDLTSQGSSSTSKTETIEMAQLRKNANTVVSTIAVLVGVLKQRQNQGVQGPKD